MFLFSVQFSKKYFDIKQDYAIHVAGQEDDMPAFNYPENSFLGKKIK